MQRKRHRRKKNHVVIVTSDAVQTDNRQFKIRSHTLQILVWVLCVVIGVMLGYIIYEARIWNAVDNRSDEQIAAIRMLEEERGTLQAEKTALENRIEGLNETIQILSDTVSQKSKNVDELMEILEKQSRPTEFPLTGSATMEEAQTRDHPICIFTASVGTTVVATARGKVTAVNDDVEYGHNIWVDHGNGYVTIYRNGGDAAVKEGDTVVNGTTLFLIQEGCEKLGYQMMRDGVYINPTEMLTISG